MQPLQGKNWFLLASQPQGGAPLTLGYHMQPPRGKNPNHRYSFAGRPRKVHPANEYLEYFSRKDAKTRRKTRRRTGIASGENAFFVLRPLGSRYCLRNFLVTHLTALSSFHFSVIGSFHFPGLHAVHCKLLAWSSVSKQHSTCCLKPHKTCSFAPPWKTALPLLRDFAISRLRVQIVQVRVCRMNQKKEAAIMKLREKGLVLQSEAPSKRFQPKQIERFGVTRKSRISNDLKLKRCI